MTLENVGATAGAPVRQREDLHPDGDRRIRDWILHRAFNGDQVDLFYPRLVRAISDTAYATGFHPTERPSLLGPPVQLVIITGTEWADGTDVAGDMTVPFQGLADWRTTSGLPAVVRTVD